MYLYVQIIVFNRFIYVLFGCDEGWGYLLITIRYIYLLVQSRYIKTRTTKLNTNLTGIRQTLNILHTTIFVSISLSSVLIFFV